MYIYCMYATLCLHCIAFKMIKFSWCSHAQPWLHALSVHNCFLLLNQHHFQLDFVEAYSMLYLNLQKHKPTINHSNTSQLLKSVTGLFYLILTINAHISCTHQWKTTKIVEQLVETEIIDWINREKTLNLPKNNKIHSLNGSLYISANALNFNWN